MDRFEYAESKLGPSEAIVVRESGVRLYDGEDKTSFENGEVVMTTHRLLWGRPGEISRGLTCLSLPLRCVVFAEEEAAGGFGLGRSKKLILHLAESSPGKIPGPIARSSFQHIKLSFKDGIKSHFLEKLCEILQQREWEMFVAVPGPSQQQAPGRVLRTGIVGIERQIQEKHKATDASISRAFEDLSKLMEMAKEMVSLSKTISNKIKEKQGGITEDETVRFKSYLLSLGIDDPVTKQGHQNESQFHKELARELAEVMEQPIEEAGGMMAMTDVYCRVNRARGLELVSPEDLLNACIMLETLKLPIRLREFESGVKVLQLASQNDTEVVSNIAAKLKEHGSLTSEELAQALGISVLLAREQLMTTEKLGKACRDDSIEGLRFYPNLFLLR